MMQATWTLEQKIQSVYAWTHRPGNRGMLSSVAKLTPQMLADCLHVVAEHKTIGAVMRDKENVPAAVRRALDSMQLATQDIIGTDGHRRLNRHEGNAYAGRFGANAISQRRIFHSKGMRPFFSLAPNLRIPISA